MVNPMYTAVAAIAGIGLLLVVILVPISISYVEYYEYGLKRSSITGAIDTSRVYSGGRYFLGLGKNFLKYQADAHYVTLNGLSVFSAGGNNESVGLAFVLDVDFTYLLKEAEVGKLHEELASGYKSVIANRAKDAIKNTAGSVTFEEYFTERQGIEKRFADAVRKRWEDVPSTHCTLDQFHIGRIRIPESVAERQLESRLQNERNDMESSLQKAQLERENTAVEVNYIYLEQTEVLRTAEAKANFVRAKAVAEARQILAEAQINGTKMLFEAADIVNQSDMMSFTYIRTLGNRDDVDIDVSYLAPDTVLRTKGAN
mmetsp:Transcript_26704/g.32385  ORF Transcript_26704/g.32385 Transcript_26704/m.32385 type:complete len:315 (+) Transcript_26704:88-1032(+)|eukprot:CAMPEP_0172510162 /NCGR_PEP_ID=MMETSP1066-20121228/226768_1 /TAXON_ID=671091 /ORGANISM="Coscinodiscus wailesii, Strain CCMP2513" /LENGTH=314 /DNA_ID=CAMNT_0013289017 /DNA_START=78 /DNA_END=1022 /DNA_ORIENTATION=-